MMTVASNISVVITCYSEGELLWDAIQSVRQQSFSALEIIVVNDASTHAATVTVCRHLETEPDIRVIWRQQNGGPSAARNDGFEAAQGELLVPLDADDLLPPDALKHIHSAFEQYPDAGFIYGSYVRQNHPHTKHIVRAESISLNSLLRAKPFSVSTNWTLIGTAPLRKSLWEAVGHGDPTYGAEDLHDLEFWIRAMALPCKFYGIPEVIYIWRKYLGRNSRQVTPMSWYRIASKHFEVYRKVGLEHRAYELLLLGSKWLGNRAETQYYRKALLQHLRTGPLQISTVLALLLPSVLFRPLARLASSRR